MIPYLIHSAWSQANSHEVYKKCGASYSAQRRLLLGTQRALALATKAVEDELEDLKELEDEDVN